jgi:uncharacterized protein (DUF2249 family)
VALKNKAELENLTGSSGSQREKSVRRALLGAGNLAGALARERERPARGNRCQRLR